MQLDLIFSLVILVVSVVLHEVAHGYMANYLGDPTARLQGRLTLNPLSHIDLVGSILLPLLLVMGNSPIRIGYAKPVPYNPHYLPGKYDEALVAFAGPGTNILLAVLFGLLIRFGGTNMSPALLSAFVIIVLTNVGLALFNLVPIPPLDGSKVLAGILPGGVGRAYGDFRANFERFGVLSGTLILLVLLYVLGPYFSLAVTYVFHLLTGLQL